MEKVKELLVSQGYRPRHTLTRKQERLHLSITARFPSNIGGGPSWMSTGALRLTTWEVAWTRRRPWPGGRPSKFWARRCLPCTRGRPVALCQHGTLHSWASLSTVSDVARLIHAQNNWNWPQVLQRAEGSGACAARRSWVSPWPGNFSAAPAPPEVREETDADPGVGALRRWVAQNLWVRKGEIVICRDGPLFICKLRFFPRPGPPCRVPPGIPTVEDWRWVPCRILYMAYTSSSAPYAWRSKV